jgi:hypothetical protein
MSTKKCSMCKKILDLSSFTKDVRQKSGLSCGCKLCRSKYQRSMTKEQRQSHHNNHKEARNQYCRDYAMTTRGRLVLLFNQVKKRVLERSLPFDIDLEWLLAQWEQQSGCCALTGLPFDLRRPISQGMSPRPMPLSPSIDQKVAGNGYTRDNARLICTAMNLSLGSWGEGVYETVCMAYLKHKYPGFVAPGTAPSDLMPPSE